jgi:hypothetical protein
MRGLGRHAMCAVDDRIMLSMDDGNCGFTFRTSEFVLQQYLEPNFYLSGTRWAGYPLIRLHRLIDDALLRLDDLYTSHSYPPLSTSSNRSSALQSRIVKDSRYSNRRRALSARHF